MDEGIVLKIQIIFATRVRLDVKNRDFVKLWYI